MKLSTRQFLAPASPAFTLIELILVMAILTMAVSVTAPALSNFFRGRSLDSEARRLLALTHGGQSRAVSEGLPMDLWIDEANGAFGLEAEPSYETSDPHAIQFKLDSGLRVEALTQLALSPAPVLSPGQTMPSVVSVPPPKLVHPTLPTIRFLPDGTISQSSPSKLRLSGRDGMSLWLIKSNDKLSYEIRSTDK
jgi:prepilin-type N-terminal cleavage/methylation domain-containing protein